jgi:hypothetical protein
MGDDAIFLRGTQAGLDLLPDIELVRAIFLDFLLRAINSFAHPASELPAALPPPGITCVVDDSHNIHVVFPLHIENREGKAPEIGAANLLVDDRESRGVGSNQSQRPVKLISEREIQARRLSGVPMLCFEEIPARPPS